MDKNCGRHNSTVGKDVVDRKLSAYGACLVAAVAVAGIAVVVVIAIVAILVVVSTVAVAVISAGQDCHPKIPAGYSSTAFRPRIETAL